VVNTLTFAYWLGKISQKVDDVKGHVTNIYTNGEKTSDVVHKHGERISKLEARFEVKKT